MDNPFVYNIFEGNSTEHLEGGGGVKSVVFFLAILKKLRRR